MPDTLTIKCVCGWSSPFTAGQRGLQIECPQCGKGHRIPMFDAADTTVDMSTLDRLTGANAQSARVNFKPLLLLSLILALAVCVISLPLLWNQWPVNVAVAGGALSWPVAVALAWLGQTRYSKKQPAGTVSLD